MCEGYCRGTAWCTPLIGAALCACAAFVQVVHAQPAPVRTVGLYIVVPGDARDAKETDRLNGIKANLEWQITEQLKALGVEVKVKPAAGPLSKTVSSSDSWVKESGVQYFLTGKFTPLLVDERSFVWRVQDMRAADAKARSRGPASDEQFNPINNVDNKRTMEDLRNAAIQVREVFARGFGTGRTKRVVLVSCFQVVSVPSAKDDADTLRMLEMSLPSELVRTLHEVLGNRGYETRGLDPTQVLEFCKFQANASTVKGSLNDQKEKADCVIEGMIRMSSAEYVEVTFTTSWGRVPVRIEPFRERINAQRITQVMAKFFVEHWPRIEGAQ